MKYNGYKENTCLVKTENGSLGGIQNKCIKKMKHIFLKPIVTIPGREVKQKVKRPIVVVYGELEQWHADCGYDALITTFIIKKLC